MNTSDDIQWKTDSVGKATERNTIVSCTEETFRIKNQSTVQVTEESKLILSLAVISFSFSFNFRYFNH